MQLHRATRRCPMFHATFSEISNDAAFGQIHLPFLTWFIATWQSPLRSWSRLRPRPRTPRRNKGLLRPYWRKPLVSKLLRHYLWGGGYVKGSFSISHNNNITQNRRMNPFQLLSFPYEIIHRFQMIVTNLEPPPPVWLIIILSPKGRWWFFS